MVPFAIRAVRAGAILVALLGFTAVAQAQAPSANQLKLAQQVVEVSGSARAFDSVIPQLFRQMYATYAQQNPDLSKELAGTLEGLIPEFEKRKEEIAVIVSRAFAEKFTEAELNDLLTFYNSPTGKKLIAQNPEILRDAYTKTQEWSGKLTQQLDKRLKEEMKKKGHTI
ncbi:MAG: DUF2059 domain-containing protein [Xanthobacteraceae bacterium]|nr:DUF2059 domain-containing protein [Xanthobacteraceae bacterium]MBX3522925.1 DUF2059 domain-containing protein [Xanthobacteraceae bacterium]MBX3535174.1 DUF2059 domain-containing protein [Xanthobacteraceae bacterium]MBX3550261.1 DUF2059 domain-containing protein [Xanthobacteraceae bacterium]MCW5674205.1 DUF2059 domain-containing protein [Xanthobacteraceae bacterium]